MKTLYLIRHAKSNWKNIDLNDIDRPLKKRGVRDMKTMTKHLMDEGISIDAVYTSPAVRAFETSKILVEELELEDGRFQVDEKLYLPDFTTLLKHILYLDTKLENVAIIGHEPSLSALINYFLENPLDKVITSSVTKLTFSVNHWTDISSANLLEAFHRNRHDFGGYPLV